MNGLKTSGVFGGVHVSVGLGHRCATWKDGPLSAYVAGVMMPNQADIFEGGTMTWHFAHGFQTHPANEPRLLFLMTYNS